MKDTVKFELGQKVYSVINPEFVGQVTGICFRANGVSYIVTWSNDLNEKWHAAFELTANKSFSQEAETK